jgi:ParB/RepB/Spo0J family partition protein
MNANTSTIPLNKLTAWPGNVRKTGVDKALDGLAASIAAHGLLQSLVVCKARRGRYAVVAGRRRFRALLSLAERGTIAADMAIPCHVIAGDANATEISLVENAVREQMHPADEFEAFLALIEDGMRPADIGARFGVTETVVQQRLKLARVSPVIIAQGEDGVFIQDIVLLESLVAKKLEKAAKAVQAEGWKWIAVKPSFDHSVWAQCARRYPERVPLSPELQASLEILRWEYDALTGDDEDEDEENPRLDEITARIQEIEDLREENWTPETLFIAGAVLTIGHDGKAQIHRGYVKPEDLPKNTGRGRAAGTSEDGTESPDEGSLRLPASLVESLTLHRTAAIGAELLSRPDIALAALVHTFAAQLFLHDAEDDTCLVISASGYTLHGIEGAKAFIAMETAAENWGSRLPGAPDDLWTWCLEQDRETLLDLLAFCMARSVNAVQGKADRPGQRRFAHADRLAQHLKLDMRNWFTATAENYFGRIAKTGILAALKEAKGDTAPAWEKAKKADLAAIADREITPTGWLPSILRGPVTETAEAIADAA